MSGFLLDMIIAQVDYRDNIEIPVYRATLVLAQEAWTTQASLIAASIKHWEDMHN